MAPQYHVEIKKKKSGVVFLGFGWCLSSCDISKAHSIKSGLSRKGW